MGEKIRYVKRVTVTVVTVTPPGVHVSIRKSEKSESESPGKRKEREMKNICDNIMYLVLITNIADRNLS